MSSEQLIVSNTNKTKEDILKEIETLLAKYDGEMEISPYVLEYLDENELEKILKNLQKKQENVIKDNFEWMKGFVKEE